MGWLLSFWGIGGQWLALIASIVLIAALGGLPLLLNRYIFGAIAVAVTCLAMESYVADLRAGWIAQGVSEEHARNVAVNAQAARDRADAAAQERLAQGERDGELEAQLALKNQLIEKLRKERKSHVSKAADARCTVPIGFVRDYDLSLPGAAGRAALPAGDGAQDERPAGLPLSVVSIAIARNNDECTKAVDRLDAENERRYASCLAWDKRWGTHSGCAR